MIVLLFYKRIIKRFSILYSLVQAFGKLREHSSSWATSPLHVVVSLRYSRVLPTSRAFRSGYIKWKSVLYFLNITQVHYSMKSDKAFTFYEAFLRVKHIQMSQVLRTSKLKRPIGVNLTGADRVQPVLDVPRCLINEYYCSVVIFKLETS